MSRAMRAWLSFFLFLLPFSFPAAAAIVSDIRVVGDGQRTRVVVDLDSEARYGLLRLADPFRLVVDMPDVEFAMPQRQQKPRGLVKDFRYGLIAPAKGRIVLDLTGPVEVARTFVVPQEGGQPARFVVDLAPTDRAAFMAAAEQDLARAAPAAPPDPPLRSDLPIVVLDPGHGGIDSGAEGDDGLLEKDVTLRFAQALARQLQDGGRVQPVLTRETDDFLSLNERMEVARTHDAALFISVHADTVRQDYVRGATVYTLSEDASDSLAEALAARENRSDILAGLALEDQPDEVANILFDLTRRETRNLSIRFARLLVGGMGDATALNKSPWRRASFKVLKAPDVPSVLLELGYLSNKEDEQQFRSDEWLARSSAAAAEAIESFLGQEVAAGQ